MDLLIIFAQELLLKYEAKNTNISFWSKYNWSQTANAAPNKVSCWKKCGDRFAAPSAAVSVLVRQRSLSFAGKAVFLFCQKIIFPTFSLPHLQHSAPLLKFAAKSPTFPQCWSYFHSRNIERYLASCWCHDVTLPIKSLPNTFWLTLLYSTMWNKFRGRKMRKGEKWGKNTQRTRVEWLLCTVTTIIIITAI